ncbi:BMP/retinoic acid-inducible neural-specific protein 3 [Takifugu flavidus]|uniref:BMP/retinoic acid-inducible neural-specific protein 3 n=1 Tax=Takifugu flavidus TaxID=433684 RepID=A0A5C6MVD0_9TELE|nr:BMP/retinoic acid-inducible neural-specific protein 3 [Takifugu flavidus]
MQANEPHVDTRTQEPQRQSEGGERFRSAPSVVRHLGFLKRLRVSPPVHGGPAPSGSGEDVTETRREFGRWKVNSLALERQENNGFSLPLDPEFLQTIRQLGRRPSLGAITDNIIRKYGTHFLLSATLGGEESLMIFVDKRKLGRPSEASESNGTAVTLEALHQLAASYFIDRESTLHKLHHIQIASTAIKVNVCCPPGFSKHRSNAAQRIPSTAGSLDATEE